MLLHWGILEPSGPSNNVAAIRFSSQVRIRSICIFPTGSQPFSLAPEVVACTEPSAFYLDVYFNAHPINLSGEGKQKLKATNALVPTVLAYPGGQVDFSLDIGTEFTTRLMIIQGGFTNLSLAIYGDTVSNLPPPALTYDPKHLPQIEPSYLPQALDPSNSKDPTTLGRSLLTLVPEAPSLTLIIRLMFCLKPSNEDWDDPDFPHMYADLTEESGIFDLQEAVGILSKPVSDTVDEDAVSSFFARVANCIGPVDETQAYLCAKLLSCSAPQHPMVTRSLLDNLNITQIFTASNLDDGALSLLLDATANPDIARQLNNEQVMETLKIIQYGNNLSTAGKKVAKKLCDRIKGWEVLEDALSNAQADFAFAMEMIKDIANDENSFGIWLTSMLAHGGLADRLANSCLLSHPPSQPARMWNSTDLISHDDFVTFLRIFIGVATVVAVYAWSDSVPVERCRERTLAILRLWQSVDSYQEIVDHLLLLRQMTFRLECMLPLDDDTPSQAGIDAEHILSRLARWPEAMLRSHFVKVMQSIRQPLAYITDSDVSTIQRVADMAEGGLSSAIKRLTAPVEIMDPENVLHLRVALAIVAKELRDDQNSELYILEAMWEEGHHSLPIYLVDYFSRVNEEVAARFALTVSCHKPPDDIAELFQASDAILQLLLKLIAEYPLPGRHLCVLACAVADIFVYANSADMMFPRGSAVSLVAGAIRRTCVSAMTSVMTPTNTMTSSPALILRTLMEHGSRPGNHDAVHHINQIFYLFDHALPLPHSQYWNSQTAMQNWVCLVLPDVLAELQSFFCVLEVDHKVHLIKRLVDLDNGIIGIGEWLLLGELRRLLESINAMADTLLDTDRQSIGRWRITATLRLLLALGQSSSTSSSWFRTAFLGVSEVGIVFAQCLKALLDQNLMISTLDDVALYLSPHCAQLLPELRLAVLRTLLRTTRSNSLLYFTAASHMLEHVPVSDCDAGKLYEEAGEVLEAVAEANRNRPSDLSELPESILRYMVWLGPQNTSISLPMTKSSLDELFHFIAKAAPPADQQLLRTVQAKLNASGGQPPGTVVLPLVDNIELPLDKWEEILAPPIPTPSTPRRKSPGQSAEMLGLVTVSPPNALLRSPEVKGLTKTYSNNDFRQLRQVASVRQNTSRLPSMHVDDFEGGTSSSASTSLSINTPPGLSASPPNPFFSDILQTAQSFVRLP